MKTTAAPSPRGTNNERLIYGVDVPLRAPMNACRVLKRAIKMPFAGASKSARCRASHQASFLAHQFRITAEPPPSIASA